MLHGLNQLEGAEEYTVPKIYMLARLPGKLKLMHLLNGTQRLSLRLLASTLTLNHLGYSIDLELLSTRPL
jgi:hypothetical protein